MTHLFLFTVGPVQGFIAQARKTRDLKAGSDMLSDIVLETMKAAQKLNGTLIFPHYPASGKADSMPNKFLAAFDKPADPDEIGKALEEVAQAALHKKASAVLANMTFNGDVTTNTSKLFFQQIEDQLEIYWAFAALADHGSDYAATYRALERSLGSIKNLRAFAQLPEDEWGRKDSITGERDVLFYNAKFPKQRVHGERIYHGPTYAFDAVGITTSGISLSKNEGLSAISAVKRFGEEMSFPSTADVALAPFETAVDRAGIGLKAYKTQFDPIDWDGQLLYLHNITEKYFERQGLGDLMHKVSSLRGELLDIYREAKAQKLPDPLTYYALVTFDGDKMGKTWAGDPDIVPPPVNLREFHESLAEHLYNFAQAARREVDEKGQTVYAGGDDFTGFTNLYDLFDLLETLWKLYRDEVSEPLRKKFALLKPLTFSAGVCVAHYKNPLGEVVREAQNAQKAAKEFGDGERDALGLRVMKRSGEVQQAFIKWGEDDAPLRNLRALAEVVALMRQKAFSRTFITVLNREIETLAGGTGFGKGIDYVAMIGTELYRLVDRAAMPDKIREMLKDSPDYTTETQVRNRMQQAVGQLCTATLGRNPTNFVHLLEIIEFFNRPSDHAS